MKEPEYRVIVLPQYFNNALEANSFAKEQSLKSRSRVEVRRTTDIPNSGDEVLTQLYFKGKEYNSSGDIAKAIEDLRRDNCEV